MVAHRTDPAQPLHHHRQLPERPALHEFLETAEFDDVQPHLMHVIVGIEQERDLAVPFDARNRVDRDAAQAAGVGSGLQFEIHGHSQS